MPACPKCGSTRNIRWLKGTYECSDCHTHFDVCPNCHTTVRSFAFGATSCPNCGTKFKTSLFNPNGKILSGGSSNSDGSKKSGGGCLSFLVLLGIVSWVSNKCDSSKTGQDAPAQQQEVVAGSETDSAANETAISDMPMSAAEDEQMTDEEPEQEVPGESGQEMYDQSGEEEATSYKPSTTESAPMHPDCEASYSGGKGAMSRYLNSTIRYPVTAQEDGVQGRVIVGFVVDTEGRLTDIEIVSFADPSLNREALRVVRSMPAWEPAWKDGRKVSSRVYIPITFSLN